MRKETLTSKMFLIALASILFVSCGGGGGGGGGASNLPLNPGKPNVPSRPSTPSTPSTPENNFPTVTNPLDSQKGDMATLKTNLYYAQKNSGASIPKDTREINGFVDGVNKGKLAGENVKVAILDSNFVDAPRAGRSSAEDKKGNAVTRRRDRSLTSIYKDVEILNVTVPYVTNAVPGTDRETGLEHGEEVL